MEAAKAEGGGGVPEERRENGGGFDWSRFLTGFPTQHLGTGVAVVAGSGTAAEEHVSVRMCIERVNGAAFGCPDPVGGVKSENPYVLLQIVLYAYLFYTKLPGLDEVGPLIVWLLLLLPMCVLNLLGTHKLKELTEKLKRDKQT